MKKLLKWILLSSILLMFAGCFAVPPPPVPNEVEYRAFFVGVGRYENGWILPSPAGNTQKLAFMFLKCRFGEDETEFSIMKLLTNLDATKANILNGINLAFAGSDDNDVSYFYYMGHGGTKNEIPIITPADYHSSLETAITVHELEEHLSAIPGTKIVFLETCHAGNFIAKSKGMLEPFKQYSLDLLNKEWYQVLASSKGTEYTWDSYFGSYFCRYLLRGCKNLVADINKDRIVDLSELYEYIKLNVTKQTVQIYPDDSVFPIVEY